MPDPHSPKDDIAQLLRIGLEAETIIAPAPTLDEDATIITSVPMPGAVKRGEGEAPGDMIGPYRLVDLLGEGGFGLVWRAEQREPILREVALKVIKPGMDSREIIARFEAERQALALMDHPHIAGVLDAGKTAGGRLYFAMELVRGVPLTQYCDAHRLTLRQRLELFVPVCQAVQHAHQKGVLHRDLKPSNILVETVDGRPVPKVIDFGIAKALQTGSDAAEGLSLLQTQGLSLIGTPLYMSPEQAGLAGQDVDSRSDIYSLGVVLYELLTGSTPLSKDTVKRAAIDEVLRLIREQDPPSLERCFLSLGKETQTITQQRQTELRKLAAQVRGDIEWIVLKALEKDRERRYASAAALAQDIEHHLRNEPVSAGPPGTAYRLGKLARRHKATLVAASLVFTSLILGLGFTIWQAVRATRAERIAETRLADAEKARDAAEGLLSEGIHGMRQKLLALGKVEVMEDMVKAAQDYYQQLSPELLNHHETQRHLAALSLNRAMIALGQGKDEEHEKHTSECLRITEGLLESQPDNETLYDEACYAMLSLCHLYMERNDQSQMMPMTDAVIQRCQTWLDKHPDTLWAMHYQVLAHVVAAQHLVRELNQPLLGFARFETMGQITERMRKVHGDNPRVLECEGYLHAGRGKAAEKLKQNEAAQREYEDAMNAFAKAISLGGDSALLREQHLGAIYRAGGKIRANAAAAGNQAEMKRGEELIQQAIEGRTRLVELEPGRAEWWRDLAHSHAQMANILREKKDTAGAVARRLEELRCRDEAATRSPRRPLLLAERSITQLTLAENLINLPQRDLERIASHVLHGLEDYRRSIEMNALKVVLIEANPKSAVERVARLTEKEPETALNWIEKARATLEPLAGKVPGSQVDILLGMLNAEHAKTLVALGQEKKAAQMEQQLSTLGGGSTTPAALHDRARGIITSLQQDASRLSSLPQAEQKPAAERITQALTDVDLLLKAALDKEPQNLAFLETQARRWRAQANVERYRGTQAAVVAAYDRALAALTSAPEHTAYRAETLQFFTTLLTESGQYPAARKHAMELVKIRQQLCAQTTPPPSAEDFYNLGIAHTRQYQAEIKLKDSAAALLSATRAVEAQQKAHDLAPGDMRWQWEWLGTQVDLAGLHAAGKDLEKALALVAPVLKEAPTLAAKDTAVSLMRPFSDGRLAQWMAQLRDAGHLAEATQAMRIVLALRERLETLEGGPITDASRTVVASHLTLAALLKKQSRRAEADQAIEAALGGVAQIKIPLTLAETHYRLGEFFEAENMLPEAERESRAALAVVTQNDLGWRKPLYAADLAVIATRNGKSEESWQLATQAWDEAAAKTWPGEPIRLRVDILQRVLDTLHGRHIAKPAPDDAAEAQKWLAHLTSTCPLEKNVDAISFTGAARQWRNWLVHLAEVGRKDDYLRDRTKLVQAARNHPGAPLIQYSVALAILALPMNDAEQAEAIAMAAKAHAANTKDGWIMAAQALAQIRAGKPRDAHVSLAPAMNATDPGIWLLAQSLTALAHRQSGDATRAEAVLKTLRALPQERARFLSSPTNRDAILARVLIREAKKNP